MNPEDIKIGQKYNFTLLAIDKERGRRPALFETPTGKKYFISPEDFESVSPENGIKNAESAPKYDPRRKFRKGDKVRFKEHLGRKSLAHCDEIITLEVDEIHGQCFWQEMKPYGDIVQRNAYFCFLELVTPVEEQEPYYIEEELETITILSKKDPIFHKCWHYAGVKSGVIALEAAEAECARLNAEYRKERKCTPVK